MAFMGMAWLAKSKAIFMELDAIGLLLMFKRLAPNGLTYLTWFSIPLWSWTSFFWLNCSCSYLDFLLISMFFFSMKRL